MKKNGILLLVGLLLIAAIYVGYNLGKPDRTGLPPQNTDNNSLQVESKPLDVSGQQLTELPASITSQTNVTSLNASNNQLTQLPAAIGNMINLEVLNIENNRLTSLPLEIAKLTKLKSADFSNNRLESLPAELGQMQSLESLNLDGYKGAPSDVENLRNELPNTNIKY